MKEEKITITNAQELRQEKCNVPTLRFPNYSSEWQVSPMGKVCTFRKGYGISKENLSSDGTPCILYGELYTTYKTAIAKNIKSKTSLDPTILFHSKKNDVIIPCSGETAEDIATSVCIPYDDILLGGDLTVIRSDLDGAFLSNQINSVRKYDIARIAQGKSIVHLQADELKKISIAYPTIDEQQKISGFIDKIDERIEVQNKIISKYETLIKGLYTQIQSKSAKKEYRICDIVKCHSVGLLSKENLTESGSKKCILYGELFTTYDEVINEIKSRTNVDGYISQGNEILFPSSTTVDAMSLIAPSALNEKGILLGGDMFVLELLPGFNNEYISYYLNTIAKRNLAKYAQGTTITHLYFEHIKNVLLYLPDITIQLSVASKMRKLKTKIQIEKEMLSALQKQKAFLLQSMFI